MRGIVHSILEETPEGAARRLAETPGYCAAVELRADALRAGDVAGLVRRAGRPVIVTVRTTEDGGRFDGSTAEKRAILAAGTGAGAALIDVEWDGPLRELAFGPEAARVLLSHHGAACETAVLSPLLAEMSESKAARLKIVPRASRIAELPAVRELLARARAAGHELCAFATGPAGTWSRIASLYWGSWGTYGAAAAGAATGDGQLESAVMHEIYRVEALSGDTKVFALCGAAVTESPSPAMHAAGYGAIGLDAIYVPWATEDLDEVTVLGEGSGTRPLAGLAVTMPLKEEAARRCATLDAHAACGSANTVLLGKREWSGFNTDAPAALALIAKHVDPRGARIAVAGAGGTARGVAAALTSAGASVTLYSRDPARGATAAAAAGASWEPFQALARAEWDVLVQATPLGRHGEEVVLRRHLNGRMVLDAAYGTEPTPLVRAARTRGLAVADGYDLLLAQGVLQFAHLTGHEAPEGVMAAALAPRRDAASA